MNEEILIALGDLTNGALNYYQTPRVVMAKRDIIETYINNLKELEKEHQKINGELREEIKELEERVKTLKDTQLKQLNIIQQRDDVIEKVREYTNDKLFDDYTYYSYEDLKQNINEILDKVEEN